jgi:hypothetical protein
MNPVLILAALLVWNPGGVRGSRGSTTDETLGGWAQAIAAVCQGTRECLMLAALASEETRFAPYVLNGDCNRQGWRALHKMDKVCDSGHSYGPWAIMDTTWAREAPFAPESADPNAYAQVALHLLRTNPHGWMTYDAAHADVDKWMTGHP